MRVGARPRSTIASLLDEIGISFGSIQSQKLSQFVQQVAGQHVRVCLHRLDDALDLLRRKFSERPLQLTKSFPVNNVGVGNELDLLIAESPRREGRKVAGLRLRAAHVSSVDLFGDSQL